jgi:endonuclease G
MPAADLYLFNRAYVVGYSYLFRQPRWTLELIDEFSQRLDDQELERLNNFRDDVRIPEMFRSSLRDYKASNYDRGHMVSSADRMNRAVVNSETFLMSNMSPQVPGFNRGVWK